MSPKMSSLAVDEMQDQMLSHENGLDFEAALFVVTPRHLSRNKLVSGRSHTEDVVSIGGQFTVSF